jgi:hypothetical protein
MGSEAHIDHVVVRDTKPRVYGGVYGRGIDIGASCATPFACFPDAISTVEVTHSLVERAHDGGIVMQGATATIDGVMVRDVLARADGRFGDGIALVNAPGTSDAAISRAYVARAERAGLSSFGARASLATSIIQCAAWDLEGEPFGDRPFAIEDRGGNRCGCPAPDAACEVVTPGLEPPDPPEP